MTLNNQKEYWDKVADIKIFTHPLDFGVIAAHFKKNHKILDYGCGYGRLTNEFYLNGFTDIIGVDTSLELIKRGKTFFPILSLNHIDRTQDLSNLDIKFDAVLLFAVLTCIASNSGQKELINTLRNRLKDGGLIYISDYYLQATTDEVKKYTFLGDDLNNYGIFTLSEGVTFRHHTKDWIKELLKDFDIISEKLVPVFTMNGHRAEAFQIVGQK